jgi:N-acylneuraminate cytidylyltransferase
MEILALIPARGGSKGIPGKNILPIAGKPAIAYSIEHARTSKHIDRVIVSTDDEEIARIAEAHGAEVPFMRPAEFAQDDSPDIDVFMHALRHLREAESYSCDYVVHLRPPTVLRDVEDIDRAIECVLEHPKADSLRSVVAAELSPYKMWKRKGSYIEPLLSSADGTELHSLPRQGLPQVLWQNGYVDIIRSEVIFAGSMCGSKVLPFLVTREVPELDYVEDLEVLEAHLRKEGLEIDAKPVASPSTVRHAR